MSRKVENINFAGQAFLESTVRLCHMK